ncbi:hypothetical protein Sru01_44270 [Sphaerisporangium rufum]|uniref:Uncharacterized protein n=1 Tax=Sphaerisporangium rufum TaxID=1381558 RepID=A0A919R8U6_9ACTN|nr:hypothetical protein [Sphaerisporangium rufum]GII79445.1 hypothetical protein Sru01_44270 [Sphaerisporangium rufum]
MTATAVLDSPVVRLGLDILGITPPPPFPSAFDEHIREWEAAGTATEKIQAAAGDALQAMLAANDSTAVEASRVALTAPDGPLAACRELAGDCHRTAIALRVFKGLSTLVWSAIGLAAAAVGVAAAVAATNGGLSLAGIIARARLEIGRVLARFRAAVEKLFTGLLRQVTRPPARLRKARFEARVEAVAAQAHDRWRAGRRLPDGTYDPRPKRTTDQAWIRAHGTDQVDIANTKYRDLPADWQQENRASAIDAVSGAIRAKEHGLDLEEYDTVRGIAKDVRAGWYDRNGQWAPLDQKWPFDLLPEVEREKDEVIARSAADLLRRPFWRGRSVGLS